MANYEEILGLVCESAIDDSAEFRDLKKKILLNKKQLKLAVKSKDPEEIKSKIDAFQKNIDELKKFVDNLNPEDYGNEQDRQLKVMVTNICKLMSFAGITAAVASDDDFVKQFGTEIGIIGTLWSFATNTAIKTLPEFQNKVNSEIEKTQKCLDKIKAKCTKKNLLPEEDKDVKESVDVIKLTIFESCHSGEITEEERDELLSML